MRVNRISDLTPSDPIISKDYRADQHWNPSPNDTCHVGASSAGGGAPKGNRNALKHGLYTTEAIETRRMVADLTRQARETVKMI